MAVTNRFSDLSHRYYKLKAKWFGKEKLNWWDRNAPLPNKPSQKWAWNEAKNLVDFNKLKNLTKEHSLEDLIKIYPKMLKGEIFGRVVVNPNK